MVAYNNFLISLSKITFWNITNITVQFFEWNFLSGFFLLNLMILPCFLNILKEYIVVPEIYYIPMRKNKFVKHSIDVIAVNFKHQPPTRCFWGFPFCNRNQTHRQTLSFFLFYPFILQQYWVIWSKLMSYLFFSQRDENEKLICRLTLASISDIVNAMV